MKARFAITDRLPRRRIHPSTRRREGGFMLLTAALALVAIIGIVGIAVDVGRIYIAKSEAQVFTDSASLAATLELDGTHAGIDRAIARVASNTNKWNFETSGFASYSVSFATDLDGPWVDYPSNPTNYRYANVETTVEVPAYFLSIFKAGRLNVTPTPAAFIAVAPRTFTTNVRADSSGAQEVKTNFREGVFPFSPLAHNSVGPHYGLVPGGHYTMRWAANPRLDQNVCAGDNDQSIIDLSEAGGGSERGYIEESSAATIRQAIVDDYQTTWRGIGDSVDMTGGAKNTERDAIITRIYQDRNWWSEDYASYSEGGRENGRRVVAMLINTGYPDYTVVQIGAFMLLTEDDYPHGGNEPWCAEYLGPWVQGSSHKGAAEGSGAYVVRLVQ